MPSVDTVRACAVAALVILSSLLAFTRNTEGSHTWAIELVDHTPDGSIVNSVASIATDQAGVPHMAYSLNGQDDVRYAVRENSVWKIEVVDTGHSTVVSLKLDSLGRPSIAYGYFSMYYAAKIGGSWSREVVDAEFGCGYYAQLSIDSKDRPHVVYICDSGRLKYAFRNGTAWVNELVTQGADSPSLAVNALDRPRISYFDRQSLSLEYAYFNGFVWIFETADTMVNLGFRGTSIVVDSNGWAHVSYVDEDAGLLKYASRGPLGWAVEVVDNAVDKFCGGLQGSSLALNKSGNPSIAYFICRGGERSLGYAWRDGVWSTEVVDAPWATGAGPSLAIDIFDSPQVAYLNHGSGNVKYAYIDRPDSEPPVSRVLPISPYWNNGSIAAVAIDRTSVQNVTLWYRHSVNNATWAAWTEFSTLPTQPWTWSFPFPAGEGYYEFYSTAVDTLGYVEPPPATADAIEGCDITPPVSTALPISPYWHTASSLTVNATAMDILSGVANVTLLYSHAPLDNSTWSPWIPLGTKTSQPWSWPFSFTDGEGNYGFHTIATDVAGNTEGNKTIAEAVAGYRILSDYVPFDPQPLLPIRVGVSLPVSLSVAVRNLGASTTAISFLAFYNSSSPLSPFSIAQTQPMASGATSGPFTASWLSPSASGAYLVTAKVDYYDNVSESNESNNVYTWTVNVVRGPITALVVGSPNYISAITFVKSSTPLGFSVVDEGGLGMRNTTYRIDNASWTEYTATMQFTLTGEGSHYVEWRSTDNAGNVEGVKSKVLAVDDTPPSVSVLPGEPKVAVVTSFSLFADDAQGCGVAGLEYRIDGGSWIPYLTSFTLSEGQHVITYRSWDHLNNSVERSQTVDVGAPAEINYKPIVAVVFATILFVAGVWASKRRPWKGGKVRTAVAKALILTSMPFVLAEAATGIISLATGQLSIPPVLGIGTAIDSGILVTGLVIALARMLRSTD